MNDPFHHLEWVPRDFRELAVDVTHAQFTQIGTSTHWRPAVNAYRGDDCFMICVEVAGVDSISTQVTAEGRNLVIRGNRNPFQPFDGARQPVQVLAMEIDDGPFERVLALPEDIDPATMSVEQRNGLLWIRLGLAPSS